MMKSNKPDIANGTKSTIKFHDIFMTKEEAEKLSKMYLSIESKVLKDVFNFGTGGTDSSYKWNTDEEE